MSINHDPRKAQSSPAWHSTLRYGDIVSFRFPVAAEAHSETLTVRPCLVLDVVEHSEQTFALLAYGTNERSHSGRGYEIIVSRRRELRTAGLGEHTRFVGADRVMVPLDHPGFAIGANGSPIMGKLTGSAEKRMSAVRARIMAEQDMAALRRAARRRARGKNHGDTRPGLPATEQFQRSSKP